MPSPLENLIRARIDKDGPMNIADFMDLALGHPEHGYYMTRDPFGQRGDFTTAPEISQMFGEMIGAWIADLWIQMNRPEFHLVECGPGRGTLMQDIKRSTQGIQNFHQSMEIHLIEISPVLRAIQKQTLGSEGITWHDSLSTIPTNKPVILIGNEFLDALPIRQFQYNKNKGWQEHAIDHKDNKLSFTWQSVESKISDDLPTYPEENLTYEIAPTRTALIGQICPIIRRQGGAILFIDYGQTNTIKTDTLQAVRNHKYSGILSDIGQSDITSHIDFSALIKAAALHNMQVSGPTTQGAFLKTLGIELRARRLKAALLQSGDSQTSIAKVKEIDDALHRLTAPSEMGELFKVICFYDDKNLRPAGF